ncbi:hypothetical protein BDV39DRAFT_169695 [Aspergillus sergii]|uniref:Uncharacterized protein n=1 Tax=Aspergillus sergii TaxID=1034303 RepID=A0A5N6XCI9_9EURO|nr:hypothetical protein BDV39DRAFT_169695 [Aspergillus sergii]
MTRSRPIETIACELNRAFWVQFRDIAVTKDQYHTEAIACPAVVRSHDRKVILNVHFVNASWLRDVNLISSYVLRRFVSTFSAVNLLSTIPTGHFDASIRERSTSSSGPIAIPTGLETPPLNAWGIDSTYTDPSAKCLTLRT